MADGEVAPVGATTPVSMDDLKNLETSLTSSMNAQMAELRAMMAQLLAASPPPAATSLEVNASAVVSGEGEQQTKEPPPKNDGGKGDHHNVPFIYSLDPPIPHPHINNRGDPPRLIPSCFLIGNFI